MDPLLAVDLLGGNATSSHARCNASASLHSEWVWKAFGECVDTPRRYVAFFIGLSSIICWLLAQAPQMITNCRLGIADEALSFWFLLQWFLGDITNLVGALLTHQLASQIATAVYFVFIDVFMMSQFLYYVIKKQGVKGLLHCFRCPKNPETVVAVFLPGLTCTLLLASWPHISLLSVGGAYVPDRGHGIGRALLEHKEPVINVHDPAMLAGYIIGCVSAVLYIGSRLPQIIKNFSRCSVEGVSLPMFILAVMGNVTYALGIFLYSVEKDFLIQKLPWLVGSVGTLCFDFTIFCQFIVFKGVGKCVHRKKHEVEIDDEERQLLLPPSDEKTNNYCCNIQGNDGEKCKES